MAHLHLDTSRLPLLVLDVNGKYTEEQAEIFCEQMQEIILRRQRYAIIADVTNSKMPSLKTRSILRQFIEDNQKYSDELTISAAVVVKSAVLKMAVSALFHLRKGSFPLKAFGTRDEALMWSMDQVDRNRGRGGSDPIRGGTDIFTGEG